MQNLDQFLINPDVIYLNHGSFGACEKNVFEAYQEWQRKLESDSVQFFTKIGPAALKKSRQALGEFIHCSPEDVVFVPNPTHGINLLAKNIELKPGDEVLTTDLEYGSMDRTWKYYCDKAGAKYVERPIKLPVTSHQALVDDFVAGINERTKIVFISEITSTTALKLPVKEICAIAKQKGITTIVDGAHSPGHIPIDLQSLQADYYVGACHKWMLTPKGSSFLYVKKEFQAALDPLIFSWGYEAEVPGESQFLDYHELNGTRDYSAYLVTPLAIRHLEKSNWEQTAKACNDVILSVYPEFCALFGVQPLCPVSVDYLGHMCSIPIRPKNPVSLKEALFGQHGIEIPVMTHKGKTYLRISYHVYNTPADLEKLRLALIDLIDQGYFYD